MRHPSDVELAAGGRRSGSYFQRVTAFVTHHSY
jgi:hypothetical protein